MQTTYQLQSFSERVESLNQNSFFASISPTKFNEIKDQKQQVEAITPNDSIGIHYKLMGEAAYAILHNKDRQLAIQYYQKAIEILHSERKIQLQQVYPELNWQTHYALLRTYLQTQQFTEAQLLINELDKWIGKTAHLQQYRFFLTYTQLEIAYRQADYENITSLEDTFFARIEPLKKVARYEVSKGLIFLTLIYLQRKEFAKAQFYLRRLHRLAKKLPRVFSPLFDLLELLIHYDSHEISMVHNLAASYKRKQYATEQSNVLFQDLLKAFHKLSTTQRELQFVGLPHTYEADALRPLYQYFNLERFIPLALNQ